MRDEVVKIERRVITITNEDETISLYFPERAIIKTGETKRVFMDGGLVYKDGSGIPT